MSVGGVCVCEGHWSVAFRRGLMKMVTLKMLMLMMCFWLVGICCLATVIFTTQPLAGEGEGTSEAAFQFEQTECRTKKCCQQVCSEEVFTIFVILKILPGWIFFHISVIERMPATTTNCNIKDPETKPILSNGGGIWYHHHSQHHYWKIWWLWLR